MKIIPKREDEHPAYADKKRLLNELSRSFPMLVGKVNELVALQASNSNVESHGNGVRALLGQPLLLDAASIEEQLKFARRALQDNKDARDVLMGEIYKEDAVASRLVCDKMRPEVERLGKTFAHAYLALHRAHRDYFELLDLIEDTGASVTSLGRVWPNALGHYADPSGGYAYAFKEFIDAGYLAATDMPKEIRP